MKHESDFSPNFKKNTLKIIAIAILGGWIFSDITQTGLGGFIIGLSATEIGYLAVSYLYFQFSNH